MSAALPPGLPPASDLPRARQTARWLARPTSFLLSLEERHGDLFTVHLLHERPWVVLSDPALVREVLTAPAGVLRAGEPKRILEPVVGPDSILLDDGERHLRRRRLLLPPFHRARVARQEATMRAVAEAELDRWPPDEEAPAAPRMGAIALEVILRAVFGADEDGRMEPLLAALRRLMGHLADEPRAALIALGEPARLREARFARFREAIGRADRALRAELAHRRAAPAGERDDVLSLLLEARYEDGSPMSADELRDQLMSLLVAGHDTTGASLSWALERLARNPEALARAGEEAVAGGGPYIEAVIRETLRLRPPFMHLARRVAEPFPLRDYVLPPGVTVAVGIPLVHRRPEVYPEPQAFRPERFLGSAPGTYTWIPFGGGVRRCIGAGFALSEMRVVLTALLARATPGAAAGDPEGEGRRLLVIAPARGARVALRPRGR